MVFLAAALLACAAVGALLAAGPQTALARHGGAPLHKRHPKRPSAPQPVMGDWEGTGPEGLPLTFVLSRIHGRVTVSDVTVGDPLTCPGRLAPTNASPFPKAVYIGPGAPPHVRVGYRAGEFSIEAGTATPFALAWSGRFLGPRRATLSEPAPVGEPSGCGWSRRTLTWKLRPAARTRVAPGPWTGPISGTGVTGTVTVQVSATGRIVEWFKEEVQCAGGGGHYEIGPDTEVGEFISAAGAFADAGRPSSFQGTFSGEALTGTASIGFAGCGEGVASFAAHPG
jgi:hypothetical protein